MSKCVAQFAKCNYVNSRLPVPMTPVVFLTIYLSKMHYPDVMQTVFKGSHRTLQQGLQDLVRMAAQLIAPLQQFNSSFLLYP